MTPERLADDCQHKNRHWRVFCVECVAEQEAHIRDLEAPPKCARGCDRDGVGSPCIHELSPDELTGVATHLRDLEAQAITADMGGAILDEIAGTLKELGCSHGPDTHLSTPPMFYREWMLCVMGSAIRSATRDLEAQVREAREFIRYEMGLRHYHKQTCSAPIGTSIDTCHYCQPWRTALSILATATPPSPEVGA